MYAKLNIRSPNILIDESKFGVVNETKNNNNYSKMDLDIEIQKSIERAIERGVGGIDYREYEFDKSIFYKLIPESIHKNDLNKLVLQIVKAKKYISPHKDDTRKTVINFYLKTNKERTVFYKNPKKEVFLDGNYLYDLDWVEECDSFVAEDFDVYLLKVDEIHSVLECKGEDKLRIAISFGTTQSYDEVYKILENHNLIQGKE